MEYNRPEPVPFKIPYESEAVELTLEFRPSTSPVSGNRVLHQTENLYIIVIQ